jgi:hypothetical protein
MLTPPTAEFSSGGSVAAGGWYARAYDRQAAAYRASEEAEQEVRW